MLQRKSDYAYFNTNYDRVQTQFLTEIQIAAAMRPQVNKKFWQKSATKFKLYTDRVKGYMAKKDHFEGDHDLGYNEEALSD